MPILTTRALSSARGFGFGGGARFLLTVSANQSNFNLRTYALANGWNGSARLVVTINGGVTLSSTSTATPACTVSGSFPGGVSLINNGLIYGRGGNGGGGGTLSGPNTGTNGVAGGGGGGIGVSSAGAGGTITYGTAYPGAAGTAGTIGAVGSGGAGGLYSAPYYGGGAGGSGGSYGTAGATGVTTPVGYATTYTFGASGGSAGGAVSGNSNITWVSTGTRLGSIS